MPLVKAIETGIARTEFVGVIQQACGLTLYGLKDNLNILERIAKEGDSPVEGLRRVD